MSSNVIRIGLAKPREVCKHSRVFVSNIKRVAVCISMSNRDVRARLATEHDRARIRGLAGEERQGRVAEGEGGGGEEGERETKAES